MLDKPVELDSVQREGHSIFRMHYEAAHVREESMSHVPFRVCVFEGMDGPFRPAPLPCGVGKHELRTDNTKEHPEYATTDKPQIAVFWRRQVQAQHGVRADADRSQSNPKDVVGAAKIGLVNP